MHYVDNVCNQVIDVSEEKEKSFTISFSNNEELPSDI